MNLNDLIAHYRRLYRDNPDTHVSLGEIANAVERAIELTADELVAPSPLAEPQPNTPPSVS